MNILEMQQECEECESFEFELLRCEGCPLEIVTEELPCTSCRFYGVETEEICMTCPNF